jgi:hypothetical protein
MLFRVWPSCADKSVTGTPRAIWTLAYRCRRSCGWNLGIRRFARPDDHPVHRHRRRTLEYAALARPIIRRRLRHDRPYWYLPSEMLGLGRRARAVIAVLARRRVPLRYPLYAAPVRRGAAKSPIPR